MVWLSDISPTVPTFKFFKTFLATGLGLVLLGLGFFAGGCLLDFDSLGFFFSFLELLDDGLGLFGAGFVIFVPLTVALGRNAVLSFSVGETHVSVSSLWMSGTSTTLTGSGHSSCCMTLFIAVVSERRSNTAGGEDGSESDNSIDCWLETLLALGEEDDIIGGGGGTAGGGVISAVEAVSVKKNKTQIRWCYFDYDYKANVIHPNNNIYMWENLWSYGFTKNPPIRYSADLDMKL